MALPSRRRALVALFALICSALVVAASAAIAARAHHTGAPRPGASSLSSHRRAASRQAAAHLQPQPLMSAARAAVRSDRVFVADAKTFKRCLGANRARPRRCRYAHGALQHAGSTLARAQGRLARFASSGGRPATSAAGASRGPAYLAAPQPAVHGEALQWAAVAGARTYLLERVVPGQGAFFAVVHGTSVTPPPVPGVSVHYALRTTARRSVWSTEQAISYPGSAATASTNVQGAPALAVSGHRLVWSAVRGVGTYILMRRIAGHVAQYSSVGATSLVPGAVPGASARYSVRTAVAGSAWSPSVEISFAGVSGTHGGPAAKGGPAAGSHSTIRQAVQAGVPPSPPTPPAPTGPQSLVVGVDTGNWRGNLYNELSAGGIHNVRISDLSESAPAEIEAAGCSVATVTFQAGGTIGGRNPQTYAAEVLAYARRHPEVPRIEVINEPELLADSHNYAGYVALLKASHEALATLPASQRPKLLASWAPTYGFGRGWAAAGGLPYADEVVVHAYGGSSGQHKGLEGGRELIEQAHSESGKPVAVTEIGWPTAVGQSGTGDSQQWTESQQAQAITNFVAWARTQSYISLVIYFNAVDYGSNTWYGIERLNRTHKPGFAALGAAAQ